MDAYERFRYIARHVLQTAIDDAVAYARDERIFGDDVVRDPDELDEHLRELDRSLREDAELTEIEKQFLCAAVSEAMEARGMEARCYAELFTLARSANGAGDRPACE